MPRAQPESGSAWKLLFEQLVLLLKNCVHLLGWLVLFAAVCVSVRVSAAIDFTPTTGERVLEGMVFPQLIFHEDGRTITYEQPRGWKYSGSSARIRFTPPEIGQAQAEIGQAPLAQPESFDDAAKKNLQAQVAASVPSGSQNAVVIAEELNPIKLHNQPTYGVTIGYSLAGEEYRVSVIFLNLEKTQFRFRVTARKKDFEKVNRLFRGSLFSLQWH